MKNPLLVSWLSAVTLTLLTVHNIDAQTTCQQIDSCSCSYSSDQVVDLSPLAGSPSRWTDVYDVQALNMYSYNPCKPFDEGTCKDVAVCQYTTNDYYDCGSQASATFLNNPQTGELYVTYSSTDSLNTTRTSQVLLQCLEEGKDELGVLGETAPGSAIFLFTLSSTHCCPRAPNSGASSSSLSVGSVLLIAVFVIILIYVVAGTVIQRQARKKTGREMLPNYGLWSNLPGLIKDGFVFVFTCGKGRAGYQGV